MAATNTTEDPTAAWLALTDEIARRVAARVREWLLARPAWLQSELISRAWADDIDLDAWLDHPIVRATGIRGRTLPKWDGATDQFFVLIDVEGGE